MFSSVAGKLHLHCTASTNSPGVVNLLKYKLNLTSLRSARSFCCSLSVNHDRLIKSRVKANKNSAGFNKRWSYSVLSDGVQQWRQLSSGVSADAVKLAAGQALATDSTLSQLPQGYVPEPPLPPVSEIPLISEQLTALGEPTLASLGLATWWPNGILQSALEAVHVNLALPWWGSIVFATVILRVVMFPLVIYSQRNAAAMHNHMPVVQALQEKFSQARVGGNPLEAARYGRQLMDYMKVNKFSPTKSLLVPLAQVPVFLSVFVGIRQMANLPVQSMVTGGVLWFQDLTLADPYYILPVLTSATFFLTVELGVDGVRAASLSTTARLVMRAMPVVMLPFILNFPSAMLCYWLTSNMISLVQVLVLKITAVRRAFNIPELVLHDTTYQAKQKKPFIQTIKESYKNSKSNINMEDRLRQEAVKFKEAGLGSVPKTYEENPLKQRLEKNS